MLDNTLLVGPSGSCLTQGLDLGHLETIDGLAFEPNLTLSGVPMLWAPKPFGLIGGLGWPWPSLAKETITMGPSTSGDWGSH